MPPLSSPSIRISEFKSLATRESGEAARELVLKKLHEISVLVLDFSGAHLTPSFADEFVGRLAETLGAARFRSCIRLQGADDETRPLLSQVVSRRLHRAR